MFRGCLTRFSQKLRSRLLYLYQRSEDVSMTSSALRTRSQTDPGTRRVVRLYTRTRVSCLIHFTFYIYPESGHRAHLADNCLHSIFIPRYREMSEGGETGLSGVQTILDMTHLTHMYFWLMWFFVFTTNKSRGQ